MELAFNQSVAFVGKPGTGKSFQCRQWLKNWDQHARSSGTLPPIVYVRDRYQGNDWGPNALIDNATQSLSYWLSGIEDVLELKRSGEIPSPIAWGIEEIQIELQLLDGDEQKAIRDRIFNIIRQGANCDMYFFCAAQSESGMRDRGGLVRIVDMNLVRAAK